MIEFVEQGIPERFLPAAEAVERFAQDKITAGSDRLVHASLGRMVKHGGLEVTYTNGDTQTYGDTSPELGAVLHNTPKVLGRLAVERDAALAVGEGYIYGDLDFVDPDNPGAVPPVDKLVHIMAQNRTLRHERLARFFDKFRANEPNDPASHYDISNEFYKLFLDKTMTYSCAYFDEDPDNMSLEEAQARKRHLVLKKLQLEPGQRLLDIGSGWGELLFTAAEEYGVIGVGITLSREQLEASQQAARDRGLEGQVTFMQLDYRELAAQARTWNESERFDRVASVGMYEHIGRGNQKQYFAAVNNLLKTGGITVLHTIAQQFDKRVNGLIDKQVFPGGNLPTGGIVLDAAAMEGWRDPVVESLRRHYGLTLYRWWENYENNIDAVKELFAAGEIKHRLLTTDQAFTRLWRIYMGGSAGSFMADNLDLLQFEFTKGINNDKPLTRTKIYT
ncbi:MAG TPA: cyclopropane-fatty-acyl-phospholipid synthase family protein [Verrucomicrobiae bacterium]|nr:cyclopropane-fatty-acyl-phospholipid synthase family protein [Verrucomicrobiae bacterium]